MKLLLPNYNFKFQDGIAEVKNDTLYIYKPGAFKEVMYRLTYMIFGKDRCYFCQRKIRTNMLELDNKKFFSQVTLDHLVPQDFGGPTITNNLHPACSECNSSKGNMYPDEFEEYRKFEGKKDKASKIEKRKFKESLMLKQERRRFGEIESVKKEWFTEELIRNIYVNFWLTEPLGIMYRKQDRFFKKYKRLPKPIIVSQNRFLLDGFNTILLAKYNFINEKIQIMVLENVFFVGFPEWGHSKIIL